MTMARVYLCPGCPEHCKIYTDDSKPDFCPIDLGQHVPHRVEWVDVTGLDMADIISAVAVARVKMHGRRSQ
jgi:hypothetical protein